MCLKVRNEYAASSGSSKLADSTSPQTISTRGIGEGRAQMADVLLGEVEADVAANSAPRASAAPRIRP